MMDSSIPSAQSAIEQPDHESNLLLGLIGGGAAMLLSAVIWGLITYFTEYQISWMAVGVGFLVGLAVRQLGKGNTPVFGLTSAALALLGCLLGNLLFYSGAIAREEGSTFLEVFLFLVFNPPVLIEVFTVAFDFMDLLFYGLAAYVGFVSAMDKGGGK